MPQRNEELAHNIVQTILSDYTDRKGFDWWWDEIDHEIREEIIEEQEAQVLRMLNGEGGLENG